MYLTHGFVERILLLRAHGAALPAQARGGAPFGGVGTGASALLMAAASRASAFGGGG